MPLGLICTPPATQAQSKPNKPKIVAVADMGQFEFVALGDLAEYLGLRTFYSEKARKVILYVGESQVKVTAMNPFVQIDDRIVQMPLETRYNHDDLLVPLHYFVDLIRPLHPGPWPADLTGTLALAPGREGSPTASESMPRLVESAANITRIAVEQKANGTLIRIQTSQPFARKNITPRFSRGWMYVDVVGGRVASNAVMPLPANALVREVTPVQAGEVAQLSFRLQRDIETERVVVSGQGNEILVSLPTQEVVPAEVLRSLENDRRKWRIDTIVLDPGHGGRDPGAIGPNGTMEKEITLQVAHRLKKLIEKELNLRVIMTRETDTFVKLEERTSRANAAQGKLFISLHCNANKSRKVNGSTTYFLGPAKTEEALEVALLENSVIKYETDRPGANLSEEEFILTAMAQNAFNHESESIAGIVQEEMSKILGLPDRGVHQAGFRVLVGASMPNILVEMAFISNAREERLLSSGEVQQRIAQAICNSIRRFTEKYEWGS